MLFLENEPYLNKTLTLTSEETDILNENDEHQEEGSLQECLEIHLNYFKEVLPVYVDGDILCPMFKDFLNSLEEDVIIHLHSYVDVNLLFMFC